MSVKDLSFFLSKCIAVNFKIKSSTVKLYRPNPFKKDVYTLEVH